MTKKRMLILILMVTFILVGYAADMYACSTNCIKGNISATGRQPLAGLTVSATSGSDSGQGTTDSSGNYEICNLDAGSYTVNVTYNGTEYTVATNVNVNNARCATGINKSDL